MTTVTSTRAIHQQANKSLPAKEALTWLKEGWQLFAKAPFKLLGLSFLTLLTAGLIQALAGPVGLGISKWVSPLLATIMWLAIANLAVKGKVSLWGGKMRSWANIALWSLTGPVIAWIQFQIGDMLMGAQSMAALASGTIVDVPAWKVGLMMGSASPINLLLLFVPMLIILQNRSIVASFKHSIVAVIDAYKPMLVIGVMIFLSVALAPYTFALSGLVLGPIVSCACFVAYQRLFR
ncbi:hypothetical protein [Alteromonas sp. KUL106]|uniref:hypothetical protein n=1 Tax=Alteromonas sp. KUL106 TaxID=2480799 RepID=UPI0012E4B6A4|nr:hypothetical protein [Alteromonas sp. KUL106]GFD67174.1 hypothetical protein KUL106_04370 [Alteromonas sp. KUL106]